MDEVFNLQVESLFLFHCDMPFGYGISRYRAYKLVEAYKEGGLHGRLKEIAATLQEEDNDVLVLYKFK